MFYLLTKEKKYCFLPARVTFHLSTDFCITCTVQHLTLYIPVFFFCCFWGRNWAPFPSPKRYVFSPILKENSPQNEVFKKKSAKCDDSVSDVHINLFRALAMP